MTVYLTNYDRYSEIIEYRLPEGTFALHERNPLYPLGFGNFMREDDHVLGLFATPEGPVFFFDHQHVLLRHGSVSASITKETDKPVMHFALTTPEHAFALRYAERYGIGANPYDNEIEDIDLLAMIASGLRNKAFFTAYTRESR